MNILFNVRVVFYVIHFAARNTLRYSQTTGSYYTLQAAQQVADIGGMGGRPARVPGKNALTFDHILDKLQKSSMTARGAYREEECKAQSAIHRRPSHTVKKRHPRDRTSADLSRVESTSHPE